MLGLPNSTLAQIVNCLRGFPDIRWAKVYGSRAKGNYQKGSDIDLAFSSSVDCSAELSAALDLLPTPYLFDVTHYESLQHAGLKEHIDHVAQIVYARPD